MKRQDGQNVTVEEAFKKATSAGFEPAQVNLTDF
jgi:hypothetical protein